MPLQVTSDGTIIDGHQRFGSAMECGYKKVPVKVVDISSEKHMQAILAFNRKRKCTNIEVLREFREYLKIEVLEASERAGKRNDLVQNCAQGRKKFGKSRDFAAQKVGLSGYSAEVGLKILERIEQLETEGKNEHVAAVKAALNKSIHGAYKLANSLGWFDPATKTQKAINDDSGSRLQTSEESKEILDGWLSEEVIDAALLHSMAPKSGHLILKATILRLRSAIYLLTGSKPSKPAANKLRSLSGLLADLAALLASMKTHGK